MSSSSLTRNPSQDSLESSTSSPPIARLTGTAPWKYVPRQQAPAANTPAAKKTSATPSRGSSRKRSAPRRKSTATQPFLLATVAQNEEWSFDPVNSTPTRTAWMPTGFELEKEEFQKILNHPMVKTELKKFEGRETECEFRIPRTYVQSGSNQHDVSSFRITNMTTLSIKAYWPPSEQGVSKESPEPLIKKVKIEENEENPTTEAIKILQETIAARDATIAERDRAIAARDQAMTNLREEVEKLEQQLNLADSSNNSLSKINNLRYEEITRQQNIIDDLNQSLKARTDIEKKQLEHMTLQNEQFHDYLHRERRQPAQEE